MDGLDVSNGGAFDQPRYHFRQEQLQLVERPVNRQQTWINVPEPAILFDAQDGVPDQYELAPDQLAEEPDQEEPEADQLDAFGVPESLPEITLADQETLARILEPLAPEQPMESTMQQQVIWEAPRHNLPKRRKDYKFCIGTTVGRRFEFGLDHIIVVKKSRGGKSNIIAIIMGQAHQQGVKVWYGDVSFKPVSEDGLNVNPLIQRCERVELDPTGLGQFLMLQDALALIDRRTEQAQREETAYFPPLLLVFEEGKAWQDKLAELEASGVEQFKKITMRCGRMLSSVISTGAGVNVNLMILSQDAQNGTLNMTKGSVGNFGVRIYHPGLDGYSLNNLLPKGVKSADLPQPTDAQQNSPVSRPWWITYDLPSGQEGWAMLDVPRMQPADVQRYCAGVPVVERQPRQQRQETHSASDLWNEPALPATTQFRHDIDMPGSGGPIITSAATGQPIKPRVQWTEDHIKAAAWLTNQINNDLPVKNRALAAYLWKKSDGRYNQKAGIILGQVAEMLGVELAGTEQVEQDFEDDE